MPSKSCRPPSMSALLCAPTPTGTAPTTTANAPAHNHRFAICIAPPPSAACPTGTIVLLRGRGRTTFANRNVAPGESLHQVADDLDRRAAVAQELLVKALQIEALAARTLLPLAQIQNGRVPGKIARELHARARDASPLLRGLLLGLKRLAREQVH